MVCFVCGHIVIKSYNCTQYVYIVLQNTLLLSVYRMDPQQRTVNLSQKEEQLGEHLVLCQSQFHTI